LEIILIRSKKLRDKIRGVQLLKYTS